MAEPLDFNGPAGLVFDAYNRSLALADSAKAEMKGLTNALEAAVYTPPTISVNWTSLTAPSIPDVPPMPTTPTIALGNFGGEPTDIDATMEGIEVDDLPPPSQC